MENLILAFVTGITTGGLSCLAVQGGLLASSLANQIESDLRVSGQAKRSGKKKGSPVPTPQKSEMALPILVFLGAKLLAYTLLGFLLGMVGSVFQLSPAARAVLQFAIGIFMIGSALRMLNVHPFFRRFVFEPPAFLRRRIRKTAASSSSLAGPLFLGLLTVLIPCGITQAMMAVALSTADPLQGAALMFAFTLGTSPVFFAVAYFATQLGSRLEKHFMRFAAVLVLLLGVVAVDTGLNLAGSPVSFNRVFKALSPQTVEASQPQPEPQAELEEYKPVQPAGPEVTEPAAVETGENVITVNVLNTQYDPDLIHAKAGQAIRLRLVTKDVYSCSRAFVIPSLGVQKILDSTGEAYIDIPAQEPGTRMAFACSMGMFTGDIIFDL